MPQQIFRHCATRWARAIAALPLLVVTGCPSCESEPPLDEIRFELCLRPTDLAFGDQAVRTARSQTLAVQNCGNTDISAITVTLEKQDAADDDGNLEAFQILETTVELPLEQGGGSFFLPVRFRPREARSYRSKLVFTMTSESGESASAEKTVTGTGVAPGECAISFEPDAVMFGTVLIGMASEQEVTLRNSGTGTCALDGARFLDGAEEFSVVTEPGTTVESMATTTMRMRFTPRMEGARAGTVAIVLNGASEATASVMGNGERARQCQLVATPASVSFPRSAVGTTPDPVDITIENVGQGDCTIASVMLDGPSAADFTIDAAPMTGTVVATGETVVATVRFTPGTLGYRPAALDVRTGESVDISVPLSAFSDPAPTCSVRATPNPVRFDELAVGLTREADVTIENISDENCDLTSATLVEGTAPDFSIVTPPTTGVIAPGETRTMRVQFSPHAASLSQGAVRLALGGDATEDVELVGLGALGDLRLTPSLQYFGIVTSGCSSPGETITLSNVGAVPVRLDSLDFTAASDPNFELLTPLMPGRMIAAGENIPLRVRMLGAANAGGHHGQLQVTATGAIQPALRATMQGTTQSVQDAQRIEVFTQRQVPAIDILFVIDNSGSMQEEQTNLRNNFNAFIRSFSTQNVDYHLGITTTDTTGSAGALVGGTFITNSGPNPTPDPVATFNALANVGTNGSATEKGLEASVAAVTAPRINDINQGFLREDALLSVVYVTDEQDSSPGAVATYLDQLIAAKGNRPNAVFLSAIAGPVPQGCSGGGGSATSGSRYFDAVNAVSGVFGSICSTNWALLLEQIGNATYAALTRFALTRPPDASSITVIVDGMVVPNDPVNGWYYDEDTNSIVFRGTAIPESGEQISVSYTTECIAP